MKNLSISSIYSQEKKETIYILFDINNSENTFLKMVLEIAFIGKITINIKDLVIKQGDSIVINAYLKQYPTPIVD
ncbi:hypothetical protein [Tenacibaculum sp. Ill]|uniref:hypothetical protein n=1 Tax=Tenacibaculum sp. Ill TaxID=3445935 RepID=UPI003F7ABCD0